MTQVLRKTFLPPPFDSFSPDPLLPSIAYPVPPNICVHTGLNPGNCFGLVQDPCTEMDYHLPQCLSFLKWKAASRSISPSVWKFSKHCNRCRLSEGSLCNGPSKMKNSSWKFKDQAEFVSLDLICKILICTYIHQCRTEAWAGVDSFRVFYIDSIPPSTLFTQVFIVHGFDFIYQNDEHWFAEHRQNTSALSFARKLSFGSH